MADQELADPLNTNEPNMTWSEVVEKYESRGLGGDELWDAISDAAWRSHQSVNRLFGLSP